MLNWEEMPFYIMALDLILVILAIIGVIVAYYFLKRVAILIINAVLGIIIFYLANAVFSIGIQYSIPAILVSAFGGIPGAILVILLHQFGIAF